FRAVHRTGHAGGTQDALAAHAAVEQQALHGLLDAGHRGLDAIVAERGEQPMHAHQNRLEALIEAVQAARMTHRPQSYGVHQPFSEDGAASESLGWSAGSSPFERIRRSRSSSE